MNENEKIQFISCINHLSLDAHFGTLIADGEELTTIERNDEFISFIDLHGDILEFEIEMVTNFTYTVKPNYSKMIINLSNGVTHVIKYTR